MANGGIDVVISYVDCEDPIWRADLDKWKGGRNIVRDSSRFRDWGNFRYLFRGIAKNMPYVRRVHLIVSGASQVPAWLNTESVDVVLHEDIIPEEYLPTFNSVTIEFFMHRIKDLAEDFVYFNDDFFAIGEIAENELFVDGKPCMIIRKRHVTDSCNSYGKMLLRVTKAMLAKRPDAPYPGDCIALSPKHGPAALTKSGIAEVWDTYRQDILPSFTRFRDNYANMSPAMFSIIHAFDGTRVNGYPDLAFFDGDCKQPLEEFLEGVDAKYLCVNDTGYKHERYERDKEVLLRWLDEKFPDKCAYER